MPLLVEPDPDGADMNLTTAPTTSPTRSPTTGSGWSSPAATRRSPARPQVALTLRLVCGVTTPDIARAFLVSEPTMAARLTRAKKKITAARIPYRVPVAADLPERLDAVLSVIHLLYTTGHTAPSGADLVRTDLVERAMALTRMLLALMPDEPEVRGLLALLLLTDARRASRTDAEGRLVVLEDQDRSLWDQQAIAEGRDLAVAAFRTGRVGRYALQAAIASLHAIADSAATTDWKQVVALYDVLLKIWPSPVVALNRAVAVAMVDGPAAALEEVDLLATDERLAGYHYLPAVRADLLRRLEAPRGGRRGLPRRHRAGRQRGGERIPRKSSRRSCRFGRRPLVGRLDERRRPPMKATGSRPESAQKRWLGLMVLALPTLLLSLDVSVLYLALPHLSRDLGVTGTEQLWILDIYSFMLAGFLVTMGTLGDRIGRRRLLLIGAAAFGICSVVAAYATSPEMLIAARALLGVAGATLMPSTLALIRNMFRDPKEMAGAIGLWFSCFMGGMTLGPLVGGALLDHFWWGSAFLLGVPVMVVLLVVGPVLLPEYRDPQAGRLDLTSVALSLAAILPVIYGLKEIARGAVGVSAFAAVAVGLLAGLGFVRRQSRLTSPLLDLKLFRNRSFSSALGTSLALGVVMAGITLVTSLYLQSVAGLSPLEAGLWMIPQAVAMAAGLMTAPRLAARIQPALLMTAGLVVAAAGMFVQTQTSVATVVIGLTLAGIGIAPTMALTMNLIMASTPPEKAGSAASLSETGGEFGVAMGIATLGSLATYVYRSSFTRNRRDRPPGHHRGGGSPPSGSAARPASSSWRRPGRPSPRAWSWWPRSGRSSSPGWPCWCGWPSGTSRSSGGGRRGGPGAGLRPDQLATRPSSSSSHP